MPRFESVIATLEEERYQKAEELDRLDRVISDLRQLNGGAVAVPSKVRKQTKAQARETKAATPAGKKKDPKRAKALEYWNKGKAVIWIAEKLGLQPGGIYYWKKVDQWPDQPESAEALESEDD